MPRSSLKSGAKAEDGKENLDPSKTLDDAKPSSPKEKQRRPEFVGSDKWTFDGRVIHSPKLRPGGRFPLLFRTCLEGDYRLEVEIRFESEYGEADPIFASKGAGCSWNFRVIPDEDQPGSSIIHYAEKELQGYAGGPLESSLLTRGERNALSLVKRGRSVP